MPLYHHADASYMMHALLRRMLSLRAQVVSASLAALVLRLYLAMQFPADAGDSAIYEELARNWLDSHVYGLFFPVDLTPTDIRVPGYPGFLAIVYFFIGRRRLIVFLVQAVIDLGTCYLTALLAWYLAPRLQRRRVAIVALWLAATCPFLANYSAVILTEVLATFLTTAALLTLVAAWSSTESSDSQAISDPIGRDWRWFAGGLLVGLGTLVRPETPLLLVALTIVLMFRWRGREWGKLVRAAALTAIGLVVPLIPWAARNWVRFHEVQFLAPRYAASPTEYTPRGLFAWTATWLVRYRDVYLVPWNVGTARIDMNDIPASAFDSAEERNRVAALLERYNETTVMTPEIDRGFLELARERTSRHPLRTYVRIPLRRILTLWFTPRVELLPISGTLWPIRQQFRNDPADFSVTVLLGALNLLYVGLAVAGFTRGLLYRQRAPGDDANGWNPLSPAYVLLAVFILVRTIFFTTVETPEPRYVLECFPAIFVLGAMTWLSRPAAHSNASLPSQAQLPVARGEW